METSFPDLRGVLVVTDPFELIEPGGLEKVVLVSDGRSGMRGVLVIDHPCGGWARVAPG